MPKLSLILLTVLSTLLLSCGTPRSAGDADGAAGTVQIDGGTVLASGTFDGRNDHVVTGTVEVFEVDGDAFVRLLGDFSLDGAPDPKVGFGKGGQYVVASTVAPLASKTGGQTYALPAGFELTNYNEAYIWCEDFSVALGVASLD